MYREGPLIASRQRNFVGRVEIAWQADEQWLKIVQDLDVPERYAFAIAGSFIVAPHREG
jgi:hypothetical protein